MRRHGLFLAATLTWLCSAGGAQAQHLYAGGLGGYGFGTEKHQPVNPYGVGLGLSAGIVLPVTPIYAGARIVGFFGAKGHVAEPTGTTTTSVELSRSYLTYGIDIGYEVGDTIVLRPMLGIGRAVLKAHATSTSTLSTSGTFHGSDGSLYLSPGVALLLKSGLLFMGLEGHYNFLTESRHVSGLSVLASLGVTL
ncbi:MAG: hypothetical protein ACHQ53_12540 [Polyangiales bacterium]